MMPVTRPRKTRPHPASRKMKLQYTAHTEADPEETGGVEMEQEKEAPISGVLIRSKVFGNQLGEWTHRQHCIYLWYRQRTRWKMNSNLSRRKSYGLN